MAIPPSPGASTHSLLHGVTKPHPPPAHTSTPSPAATPPHTHAPSTSHSRSRQCHLFLCSDSHPFQCTRHSRACCRTPYGRSLQSHTEPMLPPHGQQELFLSFSTASCLGSWDDKVNMFPRPPSLLWRESTEGGLIADNIFCGTSNLLTCSCTWRRLFPKPTPMQPLLWIAAEGCLGGAGLMQILLNLQ